MQHQTQVFEGRELQVAGQPFKRSLPCPLTNDEVIALGARLAEIEAESEALAAERKAALDKLKTKADTLTEERSETAKRLRDGTEQRPIECERLIDIDRAEELVIRTDTGDVVERRTIDGKELERHRQRPLELVDDAPAEGVAVCECGEILPEGMAVGDEYTCEACDLPWVGAADGWHLRESPPALDDGTPVETATHAQASAYLRAEGLPIPAGRTCTARSRALVLAKMRQELPIGIDPATTRSMLEVTYGPFAGGDA